MQPVDIQERCSICLYPYEEPIVTSCFHKFCQVCLLKAREYSSLCPLCRTDQDPQRSQASRVNSSVRPHTWDPDDDYIWYMREGQFIEARQLREQQMRDRKREGRIVAVVGTCAIAALFISVKAYFRKS